MAKKNDNKLNAQRGDKPEKITQITKDYMRDYILFQANTDENKSWFLKACQENTVKKMNKARGEYTDIDVSAVRKLFVKRFFPNLGKKETTTTFLEDVENLFKV